jgi:hypothetical protein
MKAPFRGFVVAAALLSTVNAGFSQGVGDDRPVDAGPALAAIALLGRFPGEVARITTEISRVSWPPGRVSYTCIYIFWGAKTANYSSPVSFSDLDPSLPSKIQAVQTSSKQFADSFTPMLRKWGQTSLPESSAAFNNASTIVQGVQDEMKRGMGPNEAQRTRVIAALDHILANLKNGKGELTAMTSVLSKYLLDQRAARGFLSSWAATAAGQVQAKNQKVREDINQQRCKGDGPQQLDALVRNANASINTVKGRIGELEKLDSEADKGLSIVLGTFVGYSSRYEAVAGRLKVVKEAPLGSTLQGLHLAIAAKTWQDLVDTARRSAP